MKNSLKYITRPFSIFLVFLMLLQSCQVYKKQGVSLEEAVASERRVKLKSRDGSVVKYRILKFEDGDVYGISGKIKHPQRTLIKEGEYNEIRVQDEVASAAYTTLATAGVVLLVVFITKERDTNLIGTLLAPN